MNVQQILHTVDGISTWVGKAAAWLIIGLMTLVCVEVFKRYIMNMPTAWIFDASNMFYGSVFMLAGAYTLAQNGHVRGDFLYSSMKPRTQAGFDLVLYLVFQCFYYVHERLDVEAHAIASMLRRHETPTAENDFDPRIVSAVSSPRRRRVRPPRTAVATPATPKGDAR